MMRRGSLSHNKVRHGMQNTNPLTNSLEQVFPTYPGLAWQQRYDATRAALDSPARLGGYLRAIAALGAESEPAGTMFYAPKWMTARWHRSRQRILLIPGSFNPLTWAHVALALNSWLTLNPMGGERPMARYLWSGSISTIAKEQVERAAWADRLALLVTLSRSSVHHSGVILFNKGLYLDQARALRTMVHPESELVIVVGFDKIVQIFDQRFYEDRDAALHELFSLARILVAPRDSAGKEELRALLDQPENRLFTDHVQFLEAGPAPHSSSQVRAIAASSTEPEDLARLAPPESCALIIETGAYTPYSPGAPDVYALRQRWLQALSGLPVGALRALPPISELVGRTQAQDADGSAIQAAIADDHWARDPERAFDDLRALGLLRRMTAQDSRDRS
jgi:nicotinic acid mononucleotide adenylyltransferase